MTKEVMGWFEERNNDGKEEELMFGTEESGKIRMLGSWMSWKEDVSQRLKRGGNAWWKTKKRLKGSKLSKRMQAKVIEMSVESTLLFDCAARTWSVKEVRKLQSFVDKAYRYVWSSKKKPPLVEMQEEGMNMVDVRKQLGVKSLRWKVEKRIYERIGGWKDCEVNCVWMAEEFGGTREDERTKEEDSTLLAEANQRGRMGRHDDRKEGGRPEEVEGNGERSNEASGGV